MKKKMISLLVLMSLSFQFIYSISTQGSIALAQHTAAGAQKERARKKLSALFRKYGPSKVSGAIALVRRYKPKGLIARFKEGDQEFGDAQNAYNACGEWHCGRDKESATYQHCAKMNCAKEAKVLHDADMRMVKLTLAMIFIGDAALLSLVLGAVAVGARYEGRGVQRPSFVIPTPWRGPSPVYEPPAEK